MLCIPGMHSGNGKDYQEERRLRHPQEGKANEAVVKALASFFDIPKSFVHIVTGLHGKIKIIEIYFS